MAAWRPWSRRLPLTGCQTGPTGELTTIEVAQGSSENISSLTAVIDRNPSDPEAYNVRGTAYGRGGRYNEALQDFDKALQLRPEFLPGLFQPGADPALPRRPGTPRSPTTTSRSSSIRATTPPISAAAISIARPASVKRGLQRFPEGDPARHDRPARLPQPRPDLSEPGPACLRHRGFLDVHLAVARRAGALQRPRPVLSGDERRGQRLRRLQHGHQAERQHRRELGQPGAGLREARREGQGRQVLCPGRQARPELQAGHRRPRPHQVAG